MARVIFTADDYGACDAIDLGIVKAINAGKINSVACLANAPDLKKRIKFLLEKTQDRTVDIGCHFTLTSGKPLTGAELKWMCNSKGEFESFTNHQKKQPARSFERTKIRAELELQLQRLRDTGVEVRHLSSHHNVLFWFQPYWDVLIKMANHHNLPIRSPLVKPVQDNKRYLTIVGLKSLSKLKGSIRKEIEEFNTKIKGEFHDIPTAIKSVSPDFADSRAYGPAIRKARDRNIEKIVASKVRSLEMELQQITQFGDCVEFMFHLIDDNFDNLDQVIIELESEQMGYNGIKGAYFDRRIAEYRALMRIEIPEGVLLSNWSDLNN